ncbi:MAG TPA: DNA primase [Xanthobacteraceae bacterium]|nr:DNA primase [Xanthobacteraceae bacterium]
MRYPASFLEELRARLPVSEVVGRRVALKKAGREWKGLSPFSKEKTPSFFVNDQKQAWFDFSSGKNGSIFDFVMMTEGVTFPEAVERLASQAGLPLPKIGEEAQAQEHKRKTLYEVMELAAKFFEATLAARAGAKARGYLADRGVDPAAQVKFRMGYAPAERFALKEHLGAQGVPVSDMVEAGLLISGDDIPVPYDRFRDRVMFPITGLRGRIVAFGGRALEKDVPAKYLNSPETTLFHKGSLLYNGAAARQAAHDGAQLVVVEGYVDVIAMVMAGFPATVAPLGTALTEEQLALLWKMSDEPVLCFDGDGAGRRAAYRAVDLALPLVTPGKSLLFATLPEGQDPDDLVRSGGREAVAEVLAGARPLAEMLWAREMEGARLDTPERRAGLEARLHKVTAAITQDAVRKYYRQDLEARLQTLFAPKIAAERGTPRGTFRGFGGGRGPGSGRMRQGTGLPAASSQLSTSSLVRGYRSAIPPREALILVAVVNHPWLLENHAEELAELDFIHPEADRLRRAVLDALAHHDAGETADSLRHALEKRNLGGMLMRVETALTHFADWPARAGAAVDDVRQWWTHVVTLHRRSRTLHRELKDAERALGDEPSEENLAWLRDVQGRLAALEGTEATIEGFGALSGRPARGL